jgi:cyclopropane-fatty-acyl-phospholipid synthase
LQARYDESFYRMWKYYLHSCAGFFRSRQGQLWQLVLTKRPRTAVYRSLR